MRERKVQLWLWYNKERGDDLSHLLERKWVTQNQDIQNARCRLRLSR